MPVTSFAGSSFTVTVEAEAFTAQITRGGTDRSPNDTVTKTLGPNESTTRSNVEDTATFDFLYDGDAGFYDTLHDAAGMAATLLTIVIAGGGATWTGEGLCTGLSNEYAAEGDAACSASFRFPAGLARASAA